MNPRVKAVKPNADYTIILIFTNGEVKSFDVKPYLNIGIFKELKEPSLFNSVKPFLGSIQWQNGQDLCPDTLYWESVPPSCHAYAVMHSALQELEEDVREAAHADASDGPLELEEIDEEPPKAAPPPEPQEEEKSRPSTERPVATRAEAIGDPFQLALVLVSLLEGNRKDLRNAVEACSAKAAHCLQPAEDLFDSLANALAHRVTGVMRRPRIDRRASVASDMLRDVRHDVQRATTGDEVARVVALVGAKRDLGRSVDSVGKHLQRDLTLGIASGFGDAKIAEQTVPIFHQGMA